MAGRPTFVPRSRAAAGHESKKSLEIYQHLSLDARSNRPYQEAVQGAASNGPTTMPESRPVRLLIPLLEIPHCFKRHRRAVPAESRSANSPKAIPAVR
jgi:hypothetical protein